MRFQLSFRLEGRNKENRIIEDNWKYMYNQAIKAFNYLTPLCAYPNGCGWVISAR